MPRYEFQCPMCAVVLVVSRAIEQRDEPVTCPACGAAAERMLSLPTLGQHAARKADGSLATTTARVSKASSWFGHGHAHGPGTRPHGH